jgi:hypothetical protein
LVSFLPGPRLSRTYICVVNSPRDENPQLFLLTDAEHDKRRSEALKIWPLVTVSKRAFRAMKDILGYSAFQIKGRQLVIEPHVCNSMV